MKLLKKLSVGVLAAAMPGIALANPAPTIIHICGSTAFRAPVTCAIISSLGNASCIAAGNGTSTSGGVTGPNLLGSQSGIFANGSVSYSGTTFTGSATTIVLTNWTGSLAGVTDLAVQNAALTFPDPSDTTVEGDLKNCTASPFGGGGILASGYATTAHAPEVAMSDSFATSAAAALSTAQIASGKNVGGATSGAQLAALIAAAPIAEAGSSSTVISAGSKAGYLGIVPFQWCIGNLNGATAPFSNITQQTASYLIKNGGAPFTLFSPYNVAYNGTNGNNGTNGTATANSPGDFVYLIGRNEDSGTRIDAFAEPQLGFVQNPVQYLLTFSGGSNTTDNPAPTDFSQIGGATALVETMNPWPANASLNTEPNINWSNANGGHGGYAGGGDVSSVLSSIPNNNVGGSGFAPENTGSVYYIGYLGIADSGAFGNATKVTNGLALSYNGVYASTAAIQNGSYTFWSYEHMYYLSSGIGAAKTFVDSLANSVAGTYADYSSSGSAAPNTNAAGVLLVPASTPGAVNRAVEGGGLLLNY